MRKLTAVLMIFAVMFTFFGLNINAAEQERYVYDRAGIFDDSEIEALEAEAKKYFASSYASLYIVTDDSDFVSYYGEHFISEYSIPKNSVVFIITANSRHNYDVYTYGKCNFKISNAEIDRILDDDGVYGNIKNGRYFEGAKAFIPLAADACATNVNAIIAMTVILSLVSGVIVIAGVTASYKRKSRSDKYPLNRYCKLELTLDRDDFRGSFVTHRRINTGNGGRGRSGGGGGSGHRGGR